MKLMENHKQQSPSSWAVGIVLVLKEKSVFEKAPLKLDLSNLE